MLDSDRASDHNTNISFTGNIGEVIVSLGKNLHSWTITSSRLLISDTLDTCTVSLPITDRAWAAFVGIGGVAVALTLVILYNLWKHLWKHRRSTRSSATMTDTPPLVTDLVLVGGGHAHVHVLKMLGMNQAVLKAHGIQVTLIAKDVHTPYSGMLPGYVSGHYTREQIHLDLNQLCRFAGARFIHAAAEKITYQESTSKNTEESSHTGGGLIYTAPHRPPLRYDCLSIDVGSSPAQGDQVALSSQQDHRVIPVKPIANFCDYYEELVQRWSLPISQQQDQRPYTIGVVGGGAGGIEVLLGLQYRLQQIQPQRCLQMVLVTKSQSVMNSHNRRVQAVFRRILEERNVQVYYGAHVINIEHTATDQKRLILDPEKSADSSANTDIVLDDCVWCITAGVSSWLKNDTPFATTPEGFIRVQDTYESISHPGVFAAGDCCHMDPHPRPKAGVFAVRAGPYLYDNVLNYILKDRQLRRHKPQKEFLGIISTGDKYGVASKGWWFCMEGKWIWSWKDYIDRKWMKMYTILPKMEDMMSNMPPPRSKVSADFVRSKGDHVMELFSKDPMRCGGCGAKVGASTVSRVLDAVYARQLERAHRLGLPPPSPIDHDDAAIISLPENGGALIQTIDYFREFITDTYEFGRIAAVHALSDVHAMGATAQSALVLAVALFAADESITEISLLNMLSGVSDVLQDEGVRLVGGHTCEGKELSCGLSIQGYIQNPLTLFRKRGGEVGDMIVITKPIGTGALFASDMRAQSTGQHVIDAIRSMGRSNVDASRIASQQYAHAIHSCTDVTGFGLVGHLIEMLMANDTDSSLKRIGAVLNINDIPFLAGGLDASSKGIFSSLQPQNANNRRAVVNHSDAAVRFPVEYPLLFDPQTAGGLMFFVEPQSASDFINDLIKHDVDARVIGEIVPYPENENIALTEGTCAIGSARTGQRIRILT